jgi:hypothetical protein
MTGRFLTDLATKQVAGKANADILTALLSYWSDVLGVQVDVPIGFSTDYASVPRVPGVFELFGGDIGDDPAAVVHDYLYSLGKYPRDVCDAVFREALIACGVPAWKAYVMWLGVRVGGGSHYTAAPAA